MKAERDKEFPNSFHVPEASCPQCGKKLDGATGFGHNNKPASGAVSICCRCAGISIYKKDGSLREATVEERFEIVQDESVKRAIAFVKKVNQSKAHRHS